METPLQRLELLVGPAAIERLKQACVLIVGIGGVGGYAAEALGRSGIGKLILVDADTVAPSNLNRQIIATLETLNQSKTEVMAARIRSFAPVSYTHLRAHETGRNLVCRLLLEKKKITYDKKKKKKEEAGEGV